MSRAMRAQPLIAGEASSRSRSDTTQVSVPSAQPCRNTQRSCGMPHSRAFPTEVMSTAAAWSMMALEFIRRG